MPLMNTKQKPNHVTASERVIQKVASVRGVPPAELEPPLNDAIDPDALDELFSTPSNQPEPASPQVTFTYHGYRIVVDEETVRPTESSRDDATEECGTSDSTA